MPLQFAIGPLVEGAVGVAAETVSAFVAEIFGETAFARWTGRGKPFSEAYCASFYCARCPGTAQGKRSKMRWHVYRCRDCGGRWGVLRAKPWVRRERVRAATRF